MPENDIEILLVEDNPADLELAIVALRRNNLGHHLHVARDGVEALDFLFCRAAYSDRSLLHPPKLVLLDLKLPKVDGLEVLRTVKNDARTKAVPIVVLTSSREEQDLVKSYHLGVNSYVQKPVNYQEFRDAIRQLGLYWLIRNEAPPSAAFDATLP
jgi:two-component system response regulator